MTALADFLLQGVKQNAKALKKLLDISHTEALELIAKIHGFADYHELVVVAERDPFDDRLRSATLNSRSSPAVRTEEAVLRVRLGVHLHLWNAIRLPEDDCRTANMGMRDLTPQSPELEPACQLHFGAAQYDLALENATMVAKNAEWQAMKINLFDPAPRLVVMAGCDQSGKSRQALLAACRYATDGGSVCFVDPVFSEPEVPDSRVPSVMALNDFLMEYEASTQFAAPENPGPLEPLSKVSMIRLGAMLSPASTLKRIPLEVLLRKLRDQLKPLSLVVIDHAEQMVDDDNAVAVSEQIEGILEAGSAVIFITQIATGGAVEALLNQEHAQRNHLLMLHGPVSNIPYALLGRDGAPYRMAEKMGMMKDTWVDWLVSDTREGIPKDYVFRAHMEQLPLAKWQPPPLDEFWKAVPPMPANFRESLRATTDEVNKAVPDVFAHVDDKADSVKIQRHTGNRH